MAQVPYRVNLSAKGFPFDANAFGRSVVVPGNDQNFNRQLVSSQDQDKDVGIPQAYYMHDAVPTEYGYKSCGYSTVNTYLFGSESIYSAVPVYLADQTINLFAGLGTVLGTNQIYTYNPTTNTVNPSAPSAFAVAGGDNIGPLVSVAQVNGRIFATTPVTWSAPPYQIYELTVLNPSGNPTYALVTLTGLTAVNSIRGIFATKGYLCWWSAGFVGWSSTLDPLDHTPSVITGAANTRVQQVRGNIVRCVPTLWGFLIYCTGNIVAAEYTGNIANPWIFREIFNTAGISGFDDVTGDTNLDTHYAYTASGFVFIKSNESTIILPELQTLINEDQITVYDTATNNFISQALTGGSVKSVSVSFIAKRYLCISIGRKLLSTNAYNYIFIFDTVLERWGRLHVDHNLCFTWTDGATIAVMNQLGIISLVKFATSSFDTPTSCIVLGKYQLSRTATCTLEEIALDQRTFFSYNTTCTLKTSLLGNNQELTTIAYQNVNAGGAQVYNADVVGANHSVVLRNKFDLKSIVLRFSQHGRR